MAPVPGNAFLNRVIVRVHAATHSCLNQEAFELGAITLRMLSLLRRGLSASLDVATIEAFGCSFSKWRQRNLSRQSLLAWEFSRLIPVDASVSHHANVDAASSQRGKEARPARVYEMLSPARCKKQESLQPVFGNPARTDEAS
jgi:hypothetical protein